MGKTLAEKIGEMATKPQVADVDIEDVFEHRESGSDSELDDAGIDDEEEEELKKAHYADVGKSRLRKELDSKRQVGELEAKYKGSVGSRKDLYADESDELISESEDDEEEADQSTGDEISDEGDANSVETSEESHDEGEEEDSHNSDDDDSHGDEDKRERLNRLVQQETRQVMNRMSDITRRDATKGYAILSQNKFFENILDTRIKLQKAMNAANVLPVTGESWKTKLKESKENKKLLQENLGLLDDLLNQLIEFRAEFQTNDHISEESKVSKSKKRSISDVQKDTATLDKDLKKYRTAVLHKWSTKISNASGSSALSSSKFKSINQTADVQVENQLADSSRLIKRTCLNRRNVIPINFNEDMKQGKLKEFEDVEKQQDGEDADDDVDIPKNYDPRRKDNNAIDTSENPYIFDDGDFYRVLLNDLIDKKTSSANLGVGGASNGSAVVISKSNFKLKKNVDTKASKGRKLNFSVQEPIANYEAAISSGYKWSDEQIDEFFAGLLGQRINFNENSEEEEGDVDEATEAIKKDDIQIFG
ncbi:rRNA-processing protein BFR2 [Nakaseomyces bracarensis]|uniref:rRNA-processing protein BFR2 n=1 Tax=Nakaseomyces bracarensis TaxID=273131 RepID=UPI00387110E1